MKMSTIKSISVLVSATIMLCFIAECVWWYVKPNRQRHYLVSYKYQTPRVAPNLESTQWGYGHVQLNTDFDLFTQHGVSNAVTYIRDKFIPANDGPSNACVVLQWFTKID